MALGYQYGNPFGDPAGFTRSTQADEIDRFNQWLRSQPWWQQIRAATTGDLSEAQRQQIEAAMATHGVPLAEDFHIDEGGNLNQKSRLGPIAKWAAIAGGAALGGLGLAGIGPLGVLGGAGAASGAPALGGGGTLAANLGAASALPGVAGGVGGRSIYSLLMNPAVLSTIGGTAASLYGAHTEADAAREAAAAQQAATAEALAFQREQAAQAQRNYEETRDFNRGVYTARETSLEPYRRFGRGAIAQLAMPLSAFGGK